MKRDMKRALIVFLATTVMGIAAVAWLAFAALRYGDTPTGSARGNVEIEIPKGATAGQVAAILNAAALIDRPTIFRLYAGQRGVAGRFKAGRYVIAAPATPKQMLEVLVKGAADELVSITIPPGKNLVEVAELFEAAGITTKSELLAQATDPAFVIQLGLPGSTLEGYLYPDTYKMRPHTPAARALVPLVRRHRQVYEELRTLHAKGLADLHRTLGWDDPQVVILASIVEKETGQANDRPLVASVFVNRLKRGMRLQTDPAVIYGLGTRFDGNLRKRDLEADTAYNTYTRDGLPPTPIALPSQASLDVVVNPPQTPYLYFVSRGDGTSEFSANLIEHNRAVSKYQKSGR